MLILSTRSLGHPPAGYLQFSFGLPCSEPAVSARGYRSSALECRRLRPHEGGLNETYLLFVIVDMTAITNVPPGQLPGDADAYLCGPPAFMADMSAALALAGIQAARIRTEVFGAGPAQTPGIAAAPARKPHAPAGQPGSGPVVSFARSDLAVPWGSGYASLLEFAEACDVPVRWSCRVGVCHTCETTLISGTVRYAPAPVDDPADGSILICCSQPREDLVLDL